MDEDKNETGHRDLSDLIRAQRDLVVELNAAGGLEDVLNRCIDVAIRISQMDCGGIYLEDESTGGLRLAVWRGVSAEFLEETSRYGPQAPQTRLVREGKPVYTQHRELAVPVPESRRRERLRAIAVIPVIHEGRAIASLHVASHRLDVVPLSMRTLLESIASHIGNAVARAKIEETLRQERQIFVGGPVVVVKWKNAEAWPAEYVSPNIVTLLGYTAAEIESGQVPYMDLIHPEDKPRIISEVDHSLSHGIDAYEQEYRLRHASGDHRWIHDFTKVIRNDRGEVTHFHGYILDVTDRKRAEEECRRLEARIQHTQKLESLGVLAGGVAHDFNNLLMVIMGNADMAMMDIPPLSPALGYINEIEAASRRAADLCLQMLAYSGRGRFVIASLGFNEIIRDMAPFLERSISKGCSLRICLAENLPQVEADAAQVRQAVTNLVANAAEAIGEGQGTIELITGAVLCDLADLSDTHLDDRLPKGQYVFIEVRDTGVGMDPEVQSKLFDPFFSTKFTGRGLGMPAVLGIVRGHRGAVKVQSEPGRGTAVRLLFPTPGVGNV